MKNLISLCLVFSLMFFCSFKKKENNQPYLIVANEQVVADSEWKLVTDALLKKHKGAVLCTYQSSPQETLEILRKYRPRYVVVVEKPEHIDRNFVIKMHQLSRKIDDDIYADFIWGIITGYDAQAAMKMVTNSTEPLIVKDAIATITELSSGKWFNRFAWIDDHTQGLYGEKKERKAQIITGKTSNSNVLKKFTKFYEEYDPDLIVTASHATTQNLEMPYSLGNIKSKAGKLYAEAWNSDSTWDLNESGKRKVYFAVGNCLIGNVYNTKESMAIAWLSGGNAATMIGYVVTTWHGRNGWGGLKYWLTTPGRYSLAEAIYLNQQDFLHQQYQWYPSLIDKTYPDFDPNREKSTTATLVDALGGKQPTIDQRGFWHDRDVLAYYGDPAWNVRLQEIPEENDFTVASKKQGKKYIITIKTKPNFNLKRMKGDKFKQEHVLDLPFSYLFPTRLKNPRLTKGQHWDVALSDDFILVYNCNFKPSRTYRIELDID